MKVSRRYRRTTAPRYRRFAEPWAHVLDFSDDALAECFRWESSGGQAPPADNGYAAGKRWLDVNVAMWREDLAGGLLFESELTSEQRRLLGVRGAE